MNEGCMLLLVWTYHGMLLCWVCRSLVDDRKQFLGQGGTLLVVAGLTEDVLPLDYGFTWLLRCSCGGYYEDRFRFAGKLRRAGYKFGQYYHLIRLQFGYTQVSRRDTTAISSIHPTLTYMLILLVKMYTNPSQPYIHPNQNPDPASPLKARPSRNHIPIRLTQHIRRRL